MPKYSQSALDKNKRALYDRCGGRCQNCFRELPYSAISFMHVKGKRISTKSEVETLFIFGCPELHVFQTVRNPNGAQSECVRKFIEKYGVQKGYHFWDGLLCDLQNSSQQ